MNATPLDLSTLQKAISSLEGALSIVSDHEWFSAQNETMRNTLIAGVIQNFEFVYEISIKMIRRTLEREADSPADVDKTNFRGMLRFAGEKGLIENVEAWFKYREMRNVTAHTYDHEKAQRVYEGALKFIGDARDLFKRLDSCHGIEQDQATPNIDIRPDLWLIVRDILREHVPQYDVWAFGSRATWKAKPYSDLDLAVITDKPLSLDVSAALNDDFSESDLPWKVDVLDWATTSESFRKIVEQDRVVVQTGRGENSKH